LWTTESGQAQLVQEFKKVFQPILPPELLSEKLAGRLQYGSTVLPSIKNRIQLIDTRRPIFPGIRMIEAFGHRSDHYAIEVESDGSSLLHIVDAFRHPIQLLHPEWYSFIDSYPEQTVATIKNLLARAREKEALIFGAHFEFSGLIMEYAVDRSK